MSELQPHEIANVCDTIASIEDAEKRKQQIEKLAERYKVTEAVITATFAHVRIRRNTLRQALKPMHTEQNNIAENAADLLQGSSELEQFEANANNLGVVLQQLKTATTDAEIRTCITTLAGNNQALLAVAEVYEAKRPDIAVQALLAAGAVVEAAALVEVTNAEATSRAQYYKLLSDLVSKSV